MNMTRTRAVVIFALALLGLGTPALAEGGLSIAVTPRRPDAVYLAREPGPHYAYSITNDGAAADKVTLTVEVSDYFGNRYKSEPETISIARGKSVRRQLTIEPAKMEGLPKKLGLFYVVISAVGEGGGSAKLDTKMALLADPPASPSRMIGMNASGGRAGEVEFNFELMGRMGIGFVRMDEYARTVTHGGPGRFHWDAPDAVTKAAVKRNIKIVALVGYTPGWAGTPVVGIPRDLNDKNGYPDYMTQVVKRYKGVVHHWEVWNEPDIGFFDGPADEFYKVLKVSHAAIKRGDPKAQVMFPGIQGLTPQWTQRVMDLGGAKLIDLAACHEYWGPQWGVPLQNWEIINKAAGKKLDMYITEWGRSGFDDRFHMPYVLQSAAIGLGHGIGPIFWYILRHPSNAGDLPKYNIMILDSAGNPAPKASLVALASLCRYLPTDAVEDFEGKEIPVPGLAVRSFTGKSVTTLMVWSSVNGQGTVPLPAGGGGVGKVEVFDCMGNPLEATVDEKTVTAPVMREPIFIRVSKAAAAKSAPTKSAPSKREDDQRELPPNVRFP